MTIVNDVQKLAPGSLIDLFVLDTTELGGSIQRLHSGLNGVMTNVVWQGEEYSRYPIEASGFELSGRGTMPRPKVRVANVLGDITALCKDFNDLINAKFTRKRTFVRYLDAVNFPGGVNPTADPNQGFADEIWFVNRKIDEQKVYVDFELSSMFDVQGVLIPRRQVIANVCMWRYRSAECSYTGGAVADANDEPTTEISQDQCGKRQASCKLRFGNFSELPYGGMPGTGLIR